MDGHPLSISPSELYARLGTASAPKLVDVRRAGDFSSSNRLIAGAYHRPADDVEHWRGDLPPARPVVVYCVHGQKLSQSAVTVLRTVGHAAAYLEGGFAAWDERQLPCAFHLVPWLAGRDPQLAAGHTRPAGDALVWNNQ
jgi:rhodanese-related sulfurtransferase